MDIKLKSSRKLRITIAVVALAVMALLNVCYFPTMNKNVLKTYQGEQSQNWELDFEFLRALYQGTQVLYYDQVTQGESAGLSPMQVFLDTEKLNGDNSDWITDSFDDRFESHEYNFNNYRYRMNYYATNGTLESENTDKNLKGVLDKATKAATEKELEKYFTNLWIMRFDEYGRMHIEVLKSDNVAADVLIKAFQEIEEQNSISGMLEQGFDLKNARLAAKEVNNFTIVYGIAADASEGLVIAEEGLDIWNYYASVEAYALPLYWLMTLLVIALAFVLTSPKIWIDITSVNRKGKWYVLEPAVLGVCLFLSGAFYRGYEEAIYHIYLSGLTNIFELGNKMSFEVVMYLLRSWFATFLGFGLLYLTAVALSPVLTLGVREYIRQYSFLYQIFPTMKKWWEKFKDETAHVNFAEKNTKTIIKIVVVNGIAITILTCFWFVGTFGVIIYSLILFWILMKYYEKISKDYKVLMKATNRIAEGDLDTEITEDIGVFEPMKGELTKIRTGFKKAVDEEIKSQRMKTELITNVSHDLKTPLTAITTYVELLKKENLTEEERKEYIDTLERKSLRLKVLIEDLFEVSKATSNNITLNLMKVDLVKLLKQVSIEHTEKLEAAGMDLRWNVPNEKVELMLDSQKTYRVFENLFVNLQKYAMPNSRIYIDVTENQNEVVVVIKNMSAAPLNVAPEELTERFVRGDASRNTEGSGLGLAIAKSFTEAQKGKFEVAVDGDLFKTILRWEK